MGADQQFSLRWNNYLSHITNAFDSLRSDEDLVDVTLSCEGKKVHAHKMLLSACSTYFKDLFKENPCRHPIIILQNVKFSDLSALISFMYQGEVNVEQEQLPSFLQTAELLAIQGLTEDNDKEQDIDDQTDTIEVPDSPEMIPAKPEHSVSKPIQRKSSIAQNPLATNMGSPSSVYPDSMPPAKRRRGMGSKGGGDRDSEHVSERRQSVPVSHAPPPPRSVSPDPVEIIPLAPVKSEVSDYIDQSQEDVSSYADSHGGDSLSQIEQIMIPSDTKTEILYGNDSSMLSSGDSLSAADLKMRITNRENQQKFRQRLNADPTKKSEFLRNRREAYQRKKEEGKIKSVTDLKKQDQKALRKIWRERKQALRMKQREQIQKQNKNVCDNSALLSSVKTCNVSTTSRTRECSQLDVSPSTSDTSPKRFTFVEVKMLPHE